MYLPWFKVSVGFMICTLVSRSCLCRKYTSEFAGTTLCLLLCPRGKGLYVKAQFYRGSLDVYTRNVSSSLVVVPIFPLYHDAPVGSWPFLFVSVLKTLNAAELGEKVAKLLPKIGNIVADDVPVSNDEDKDNKVVSTYGPNPTGAQYMHHHEVCISSSSFDNDLLPD